MNLKNLLLTAAPLALSTSIASAITVATYATDWVGSTTTGITTDGTVLTNYAQGDWETVDPVGNHTFVDVESTYAQVTGDRLFYDNTFTGTTATATITLTGLAAFDSVSIDSLIVGAGGGIDHNQADGIEVTVNGTSILNIDLTARDRDGGAPVDVGAYLASAPASVILEGWAETDTDGSEFINTRTDGWGHDALYDLGADPAFDNVAVSGAGTVTIEVISRLSDGTGGSELGNDEQIVVGNFAASFDAIPEPSAFVLLFAGAIAFLRRSRA